MGKKRGQSKKGDPVYSLISDREGKGKKKKQEEIFFTFTEKGNFLPLFKKIISYYDFYQYFPDFPVTLNSNRLTGKAKAGTGTFKLKAVSR